MGTLHEGRLDKAIDPGSIGVGETVDIHNRMGVPVATGDVIATTPFGLVLKEGFFNRDLYLFVPVSIGEPESKVDGMLLDGPDARVAAKLAVTGEMAPVYEADKFADSDDDEPENGSKDDKEDGGDEKEPKDDMSVDKEPLAKPESSVDVDKLPEDIKKAVVSTTQMNAEELNGVLADIGDSAVKALKRVNVKDTEIYGVANKIQNAIYRILTGHPPAPPAPPKKAKGK